MLMIAAHAPIVNKLLAALPALEYQRLEQSLESVSLVFAQVLYEPGAKIDYVYFPNDSLVSLLVLVDRHMALEVGMVGREGMVGVSFSLGVDHAPLRALVQGAGTAMRMKSEVFYLEFSQALGLQRELHLYTHALMIQIAQTAACNRFHVVEARLARWLLMTRDRLCSDHFYLTHEFMANMLGVRRVGVTKAAHELKLRHLIDYSRGNIVITNVPGLEAASCSCYAIGREP